MDDKDVNNKYDRQVRLWNPNGQQSLMNSKICLINVTAEATETLKNLVLPGVGEVVIIDHSTRVTEADLSSNFFLLDEDLGQDRAEKVAVNLSDLNSDVKVSTEKRTMDDLIEDEAYWLQYGCVITCSFFDDIYDKLAELLWRSSIPLVNVAVVGFYAYLKISNKQQTIVETHNNSLEDLRIDRPWKELQNHLDSIDIDSLDAKEVSDLPFSILLTKLFQKIEKEKGKRPNTAEIRAALRTFHLTWDETNIEEANKKAAIVMKDSCALPYNVEEIFADSSLKNLNLETPIFWIYVSALKLFYERHQTLPLSGVLPDMTSDTNHYITLQNIYKAKHESDTQEMISMISSIMDAIGRSKDDLNEQEIAALVKNSKVMEVHNGSMAKFDPHLFTEFEQDETKLHHINIYLAFLSYENFQREYKRAPTSQDKSTLRTITISLLCRYDLIKNFPEGLDLVLDEMLRAEGCHMHNICALIGGMTAQEVIKLLTNQYITLDNCLTFDGISSQCSSFKI
ncbi:hypothetical protein CANARDRAFT_9766 [[Candida] arabinofermentans NRRL YB-2248]|uniref:NEDD8-activating enzyme E1 regulatory subunit n=1 Tax=[Candida] arabinofermentans NRRL YB-2248 TaxID=983967 RepID=A0A1E4SUK2_9ASCO|nr:hypothetical protein CANARDRAFT_9766 [[Candida] arabinofermentans NRRL YB-2248]